MKTFETGKRRVYCVTLAALILLTVSGRVHAQENTSARRDEGRNSVAATPLSFREFFEPSASELKPSAKLLILDGKRVRLVGFMVQMEQPPQGSFYLAPRPVFCDEEGGGDADLPPESVLVIIRSAKGKEVAFIPGPIEVTGVLEIGSRPEQGGQVSRVRLTLDGPQDAPRSQVRGASGRD